MLWLVLAACSGPGSFSLGEQPPVEVRTALDGSVTARGGRFELVVEHEAELDVPWPEVLPTRLDVEADGEVRTERVGDRVIRTREYVFTGDKGSHVIPAVTARWTDAEGEHSASSQPLYVDLGVRPPRPGELADIPDPSARAPLPWALLATVFAVILAFAIGLWAAFRNPRQTALAAVPPEPPDVVALRAWEAVKGSDIADYDKALAISRIFREYAEAVLAFKATAKTTTEILERLRHMLHLEEGNVPRAKRLLRATDRIKFAEVSAKEELFDELDADLRAFVASTRPHHWAPEEVEGRVVREARTDWARALLLVNRIASMAFAGAAVAVGYLLVQSVRAGGLPLAGAMFLFGAISAAILLAGLHAVLAYRPTARHLRWLQLLAATLWLIAVPIGTAYGLFAWYVVANTSAGRELYGGGA